MVAFGPPRKFARLGFRCGRLAALGVATGNFENVFKFAVDDLPQALPKTANRSPTIRKTAATATTKRLPLDKYCEFLPVACSDPPLATLPRCLL